MLVKIKSDGGMHPCGDSFSFGPEYEKIVEINTLEKELSKLEMNLLKDTGFVFYHGFFDEIWHLEVIE